MNAGVDVPGDPPVRGAARRSSRGSRTCSSSTGPPALGLYVLARRLGAAPDRGGLAAATYAFSGAMVGQLVHLGVVQGQALLPWLVVVPARARARACLGAPRATRLGATSRARAARHARARRLRRARLPHRRAALDGRRRRRRRSSSRLVELVAHGSTAVATLARPRRLRRRAPRLGVGVGDRARRRPARSGLGVHRRSRGARTSPTRSSRMGAWPARWLALLVVPGALGDNGVARHAAVLRVLQPPRGHRRRRPRCAMTARGRRRRAALSRRRGPAPRRRLVRVRRAVRRRASLLAVAPATRLGAAPAPRPAPRQHAAAEPQHRALRPRRDGAARRGGSTRCSRGAATRPRSTGRAAIVTPRTAWATVALCALALVDPGVRDRDAARRAGSAARRRGHPALVARQRSRSPSPTSSPCARAARRATRDVRGRSSSSCSSSSSASTSCSRPALVTGDRDRRAVGAVARARRSGTAGRTALVDPGVVAYHETAPLGLANLERLHEASERPGLRLAARRALHRRDGHARASASSTAARSRAGSSRRCAWRALAVARERARGGRGEPAGRRRPAVAVRRATPATRYFGGVRCTCACLRASSGAPRPRATRDGRCSSARTAGAGGARPAAPLGRALVATFPSRPRAVAAVLAAPRGFALALDDAHGRTGARRERLDTAMQVAPRRRPAWHLVGRARARSRSSAPRASRPPVWLVATRGAAPPRRLRRRRTTTARPPSSVSTPRGRTPRARPRHGCRGGARRSRARGRLVALGVVVPHGLVQSVVVPAGRWPVEFAYHAPHLRRGRSWRRRVALLALARGARSCWLAAPRVAGRGVDRATVR